MGGKGTASKPHVIVIMADQLRYDVCGGVFTPHLNRLARESFVFERAYCASPLCVPARGAFFTGLHPNVSGCLINPWEPADAAYGKVRAGTPSLYSLLETGWDSVNVGKQHFVTEEAVHLQTEGGTRWLGGMKEYKRYLQENGKRAPGGPAFKTIVPEMAGGRVTRAKGYSSPAVGCYEPGFDYFFDGYFIHQAIEAVRQRDRSKPLLLNMMFLAPHPPLDIPEPWFSKWNGADLEIPDNVGRWAPGQSPLQLYNLTGAVGTRYSREEWSRIWQVYLGLVSLLDDCIGMLIDELKAQGIYDDSLILFTSDHGEMLGSHGLWQKMCMYEESVRTPLVMKFPATTGREADPVHSPGQPRRIAEPVSAVDMLPTLCDYLGMEAPQGLNGVSLMPLLRGEPNERGSVFIQFDGNGARGNFQRCMVKGRYKLIVDQFKDETFIELYDIEEDPQEQLNLAIDERYAVICVEWLAELRSHMTATGDLLELPEAEALYKCFIEDYTPFQGRRKASDE